MKLLTISAFYPPFVIGGAEICARNLSTWFAARGDEVSVMTAAPTPADERWGESQDGVRVFRVSTPHLYPVADARDQPGWKKPLWHVQDVLDPRTTANFDRVLDEVRPDFVHIHWIQGLGYRGLLPIARRDIPTAITLHDLAYPCLRTTMFRDGHECLAQCADCRASATVKNRYLRAVPRLGFISPSRAILAQASRFMPTMDRPTFHIHNPNIYPSSALPRPDGAPPRLLFVGRLENTKGIVFLLDEVLAPLAERRRFTLDVLGKGPEEEALRRRYAGKSWVTIHGQVPLQAVADAMATADLCLMPSLWAENSPGVVFQALAASLPVMASDKGGLPELIVDGENGLLAPPGDAPAWTASLELLLDSPDRLRAMRAAAGRSSDQYGYDHLAQRMADAYDVIRTQPVGKQRSNAG